MIDSGLVSVNQNNIIPFFICRKVQVENYCKSLAVNHMWIDNIDGIISEARSKVTGLYENIEQAKVGLNEWFMKVPNNGCEITEYTNEQYSFISPDGKTRGFVEIQEIEK